MTTQVLPTLAGLGWSVLKTPMWSTRVKEAVNGKEVRGAFWSRPRWKFTLTYSLLSAATAQDLQTLMGFFCQMQGAFTEFYYVDPTDSVLTAAPIGTGDGVTTVFEVVRTIGGFTDFVLLTSGGIYVDGVLASPTLTYGKNSTTATFAVAPANGKAITVTGVFSFRVRFIEDMAEFENFMYQLWTLKKLDFVSVK